MRLRRVQIIGPGRVGRSIHAALAVVGWQSATPLGRGDDVGDAAVSVDLVLITTPDHAIAETARQVRPNPEVVMAHCSGALTLDVLAPHTRVGSLHPLAAIADVESGMARLRGGCAFAVAGDPLVAELALALGGRPFPVPEGRRTEYHAAAVVASNHLVALLGQVQRIAAQTGVPLDAYLDLASQTLDNVRALGPAAALTGPVARGDWTTVANHLRAIDPEERRAYEAMANEAARLVGTEMPEMTASSPTGVVR